MSISPDQRWCRSKRDRRWHRIDYLDGPTDSPRVTTVCGKGMPNTFVKVDFARRPGMDSRCLRCKGKGKTKAQKTRIDMRPVFDHGGFQLEGGRLLARVGGFCSRGPVGWLAYRGRRGRVMLGRVGKRELAAALGFGPGEWYAVEHPGVRLTNEEWRAAYRTPAVRKDGATRWTGKSATSSLGG